MQVARQTINNKTHLVTNYVFMDDTVGINLETINEINTLKSINVDAIPIKDTPILLESSDNNFIVSSELRYTNNKIIANLNTKNCDKPINECIKIDDDTFAQDMINTCLLEKKGIKSIACYNKVFDDFVNKIKENALSNNLIIKTPVWNNKIFVYSSDMELLGVANRLTVPSTSFAPFVLCEYIGKKLKDYIAKNIILHLCLNSDITLEINNLNISEDTDSYIGYVSLDCSKATIKKISSVYENSLMVLPKNFKLPDVTYEKSIDQYHAQLLMQNTTEVMNEYYKKNKIDTSVSININKYLIW